MGKKRGGRPKDAGKELEITQRRARVASMILAGVSYRQIAEREGVALATVAADKAAIVAEWQEAYLGDVAALFALLGGRRQGGKDPGEEGERDHDHEIEADRQRGRD